MPDKFCHVCEEPVPKRRSKYCSKKCATSASYKANYKNRYQDTKEYQKAWYEARMRDPEYRAKRAKYTREYRQSSTENRMLTAAKDRSKLMGLDFNLELSDIVIPEICPVLAVPMIVRGRHAPSLDRIEPTKGYVKGNIQVISRKANTMKNDATPEELKEFALWVLKTYQP